MKKCLTLAFAFLFGLLSACHHKKPDNQITVGTIAGPETQLMQVTKKVAKKRYNLNVKIVTFTNYSLPNRSLSDGDIDANAFQHKPYLLAEEKARGYNLTVAAKTFIYPMGIYSKKITSLKQLKKGDAVAIPNDPTNEGRALLLLAKANLITLKPGSNTSATPEDILKNPLALKIKPLDAANITRSLSDVTIATINTNYALLANLYPSKNALFVESKRSPYANIIVVRQGEQHDRKVRELVKAYQSKPVVDEAKKLFKGEAIVAWQQHT